MKPLKSGRVGTSHIVHYREVVLYSEVLLGHVLYSEVICIVSFVQRLLYSERFPKRVKHCMALTKIEERLMG